MWYRPQFAAQFWIGAAAWPAVVQYAAFDPAKDAGPLFERVLAGLQARDEVDLVIVDAMMPEMNGLSVLEKVRSMNKTIPFVMVTAKSDVESVLAAKRLGVTAYVTKPFSTRDLVEQVKRMLGVG